MKFIMIKLSDIDINISWLILVKTLKKKSKADENVANNNVIKVSIGKKIVN